jgi:tetratricopeptide (TPR) repeat protein/DNA-binding CsgD family transcriptional regulator
MKKALLLPVLLIFSNAVYAQQADTTLVRQLHNKAFGFFSTFPDSLLYYRDSSFHLAQRLNDNIGIIDGYIDLGIYHWIKGNFTEAIDAYTKAQGVAVKIKNEDKIASVRSNLGMVYAKLGDYPKAITYYLDAIKIFEQLGKKAKVANVYNSLGVAYRNNNHIDDALNAYNTALGLFIELDNALNTAGCYTNMGNIYQVKGDLKQALDYQFKALQIFDSLQNYRGQVVCFNNISDIQLRLGNVIDAKTYREKALTISRAHHFFSSEVVALLGMGTISLSVQKSKEAEQYLLEGISRAREKNFRSELVNLYHELSACYKQQKRNELALEYYEKYAELKDSLFNSQNLSTITNLRLAYDVEKKEADILLLKKDNEINRLTKNLVMGGSLALLLMAGLVVARQQLKIRNDKQLLAQREQLHKTEQALTQLELNTSKLKEDELRKELDYKNKSLTTYALNLVQKNEILEEVRESVELLLKGTNNQDEQFKRLSKLVDYSLTLDKDWDDFKLYFDDVHQGFFSSLQTRYPDLTGADIKLCALLRLNLNMKQAATILRISPESVKMARHRLRKKFNLQTEENLTGFIMSI